jgi:predicted nucleotidyltransferase
MGFMELQQLSLEKLNHVLVELRRQLNELYGSRLVHLVLYGSQARGDAMPGSDVDVLVVLAGQVDPALEIERVTPISAALSLEYDIVISCVYVSDERYIQENSPLLLNVRREGVVV